VSSGFSTNLADDLQRGKLDVAFLRAEPKPNLEYRLLRKEPLVVVLPSRHPLAASKAIDPRDLRDTFSSGYPMSRLCCALR
jgi:LysR family transcriptional regulator, hca operon transcriptional activator